MSWIFPAFFGLVALCAVLYGVCLLVERIKPRRSETAVLEAKRREKFPFLTVFGRRDKVDYTLIFRSRETGKEIPLTVKRELYRALHKNMEGELVYRGEHLLTFLYQGKAYGAHYDPLRDPDAKAPAASGEEPQETEGENHDD